MLGKTGDIKGFGFMLLCIYIYLCVAIEIFLCYKIRYKYIAFIVSKLTLLDVTWRMEEILYSLVIYNPYLEICLLVLFSL